MSTLEGPDVDTESGAKPRRPDRAVYVPRALRAHDHADDARPPETKNPAVDAKCPKSPAAKDRSAHGTPKRSLDKQFCNVYTPPHLRHPPSAPDDDKPVPSVPNSDSAISFSDTSCNEVDVADNFYIGDYFANGQLGFYRPSFFEYENSWSSHDCSDMAVRASSDNVNIGSIIDSDYLYSKDEDVEANELKRASQEINRSSKRIIKQSFDSDVLVISDPIEEAPSLRRPSHADNGVVEAESPKPKLQAKVSLKREENDWDAVFDDSGECLDPSLLEELTSTVGKVHITKTKNNYEQYQTRGQALFNAPFDETFAHVVEVYDFPSEFKTNDLLALFSEYKETGFEIKWVDDTHALIVFSSAKIAAEALSAPRSLGRVRPLHAATLESRNKAKKCAEFLQPYRQRPETCTALARRLVSGALGVRLSTAQQERAEERRLITRAREKKRQAALHKEAAWDGSLANTSLDA
ncbi:coiled-coil domain-containing protein R3HCC1L isoform X1 [Maniola jurtina]|uniref:coiled-coil domain-containing protein R3HCC1L isoform X1 n=1 Tax=Maniola jurtina TaxID=191418 RepID=UPI001E688131|nr:coiled-coil domain-containing protein R3HCC1L isoform X1 [Maniola jurtina]